MEENAMSKLQEVQLTDNTTVGIAQNGAVTECASVKEDENKEKFGLLQLLQKMVL